MPFTKRVGIIGGRRLPIGKMAGNLSGIDAYQLQAHAFKAAVDAAGLNYSDFDELIVGNVTNSFGNIARIASTEAGVPVETPAYTIDRQCASSMEALSVAASKINSGIADCLLIGGVESASRSPWLYEKTARPYSMMPPKPLPLRFVGGNHEDPPMGETAEILADEFSITREEMDRFSVQSHQRAGAAHEKGWLDGEVVSFDVPQRKGDPVTLKNDETVRPESNTETLGKLRPVFRKDGRVTAGNSSPLNDGAVAAIVASEQWFEKQGLEPDAWLLDSVAVGLEPRRMGMGPADAIEKLYDRNHITKDAIDLFEINEAFAAQLLAVNSLLKISEEKLNIHGGAIALGHPLGVSGLRIVVTLINALKRTGGKRGIASLCVGGGQGMGCLVEI